MVKIAVAGGTGEVAREIIDALIETNKHDITVLSRTKASTGNSRYSATWRVVNYDDRDDLVDALRGTHTVLSFIQITKDPGSKSQKNLIDAAIVAGVKRFAPSEWGSSGIDNMPWYEGKEEVRQYLRKVNESGKVLQYTLFQPGLFLDYLAFPHKTAKHLTPLNTFIDFQNRRAIVVDDRDAVMTLTTIQDLAAIVARAVDLGGEWPVTGGVSGNRVAVSQVLQIGEKVRGSAFTVDRVKLDDLENGNLTASWTLEANHPSYSGDEVAATLKMVLVGTLLSSAKGAWAVSDEFNHLLPDYKFTQINEFLAKIWERNA